MLYKVTPMMEPEPQKKQRDPGAPRKRRATAIYDRDGNEVLVSLMCLKCKTVKPLAQFGLRKMADGAIRNQPWCRNCRSGASAQKPKRELESTEGLATSPQLVPVELDAPIVAEPIEASAPTSSVETMFAPAAADSISNASPVVAEAPQSASTHEPYGG